MKTIEQFLSEYNSSLSATSKNKLENILSVKHYKKSDIIAGRNQKESKFFILQKGVICSFLVDQKGKRYIRTLFTPISVIAPHKSLINPPNLNVDYHCLSDSIILETKLNLFLTLTEQNHDISILFSKILMQEYLKLINRVTQLTTLNATDRYLLLKKSIHDIEKKIPLHQIASYLNITAVQLSRIRKKLYST
ncbi:Crp/Fnr family transcriptional regulator [Tenacibaculum sp. nBUS_03]|uniref:Crp/Fnr family transcriptional regulator n=1 Tax=Tenacibaculum sp. nBUS_03 TaxID=3395320 RepID=UPI003EBF49A4